VGIGTSSPSARLEVFDTSAAAATSLVQLTGQNNFELNIQSVTTTNSTVGARYNFAINSSNGEFSWSNSGGERARIDTNGNLLVNTTSIQSNGTLSVVATSGNCAATFKCADNGSNVVRSWMATASGTRYHIAFGDGTSFTERGVISTNGSTTTYGTGSDYRLKEDVQTMTGALSRVAQLRPVFWKWKESKANGEGFIAHELQAVVPDAVVGEKDAVDENGKPIYQNVDTSFLVATLTAAIQEQQALITSLTARIAALEGAAQ
jgi:hypothetical protein